MDRKVVGTYPVAEAARYVHVAPATLRSWVLGRSYQTASGKSFSPPLIQLPDRTQPLLSFENLIEAHVLWGLRNRHDVALNHVRIALEYAQRELDVDRLLLHEDLRTSAGDVFFIKYGQLLNLSRSGQLALRKVLESHLLRVEWINATFPVRLYPFSGNLAIDDKRLIVIDPLLHFGRPIVQNVGISTSTLADRFDNGEEISDIAEDYGMTATEIEAAILFEKAA